MHDLKVIRDNPDYFDAAMASRGISSASAEILRLDEARRGAQTRMQEIQNRRNTASKEVGQRKAKGEDADDLIAEVQSLKDGLAKAEEEERLLAETLDALLAGLPNIP